VPGVGEALARAIHRALHPEDLATEEDVEGDLGGDEMSLA